MIMHLIKADKLTVISQQPVIWSFKGEENCEMFDSTLFIII